MDSAVAITNLLGRYGECIDLGDLAGAAALFTHAKIKLRGGDELNADRLEQHWRNLIILYEDGTPRTKHVITNPIVEVDEAAGTATCRSYYTVFQEVLGFPLQPIVAGRYHDWFERADGTWRFSYRDYSLMDLLGDLSRHIRIDPTKSAR